MCGIFGSPEFNNYEHLYHENKVRGTFSYGSLYANMKGNIHIRKRPGIVNITGDYAFTDDYNMYLGHTQAPTSVEREFSVETSHPFDNKWFIAAHNGVLENHEEIVQKFFPKHKNPVDSSVIPALMSLSVDLQQRKPENFQKFKDEGVSDDILAITFACGIIKGIFSCWIYSKTTGCTYAVRCGSTLYGNKLKGNFSSIPVKNLAEDELDEGIIYCVTGEGLVECGEFDCNSQFFI